MLYLLIVRHYRHNLFPCADASARFVGLTGFPVDAALKSHYCGRSHPARDTFHQRIRTSLPENYLAAHRSAAKILTFFRFQSSVFSIFNLFNKKAPQRKLLNKKVLNQRAVQNFLFVYARLILLGTVMPCQQFCS